MNCRNAHDLLQQSLDGTPVESLEWLAHLQQCAECRALASAGRRLQDGLRLLTAPLPPPGLTERIVERALLDRRRARRRLRRRWAIGVALAASLLLALIGTTRQLTLLVRPTATANRQRQLPGGAVPTLRQSAAELGEVFVELSNETAQETVGQTRRLVSNVPSPTLPRIDLTAIEPSTHSLREAGEGLSEGLEPVTTSARRAVDLFLRELPMETKTN
jgi:anti-sigma factor RsiW